jgi:hypothetical protein
LLSGHAPVAAFDHDVRGGPVSRLAHVRRRAECNLVTELATGFERFAIVLTAGSFRIGPGGEPLFRFFRSDRPYVLKSHRQLKELRMIIACLVSVFALALTTSTKGHPLLFLFKLLTMGLIFLVPWLYVRRLPRTVAAFPAEEANRERRAAMNRQLALALAEVLFGWAILSAAAVPFRLDTSAFVVALVGGGLSIDGVRRLLRREPLPAGVLSD